ncbi:helix-turn-helix domain-containing protein [Allostreptomyces psammosilenae]|uniref:DNA-binding XRE family transcriptional regulator n=1 Tax=Allostreptomyces psammosilenae TaxID=1892865 RepID=A0A852ZX96_9ACTN|nr:helix-turn-helix transcriptional regulator [Allostreptomyces psammosilenae]NYI05344.1 DNA-binding XRE family transcriptional regulator [Allostreptomyces psammosilenae]
MPPEPTPPQPALLRPVDVGAVIRGARAAARLTQRQLGQRCGYSASAISRIESGDTHPNWDTLRRIAHALDIPATDLGLPTPPLGPPPPTTRPRPTASPPTRIKVASGLAAPRQQEDDVRRRNLLAGALGISAAHLLPHPASAASQPTTTSSATALEHVLFQPTPTEPLPLQRLVAALTAARADFRAARYADFAAHLPALIAAAESTRAAAPHGRTREQAAACVARAYVLATELAIKSHADLAWATADRALTAARASAQTAPIAEAARVLAITMRRAGRPNSAVDLLVHTATTIAPDHGNPHPADLAARTTLLLTAAYSAAAAGDRTAALTLADEAEQTTHRIPRGRQPDLYAVEATPAQCDLYRIGIHTTLGTPDEAVPHATHLTPADFPTIERRARFHTDTARMWHALGDPTRTLAALRAIERDAPEEVRRPSIQALTANLLYAPTSLPGLKEFAHRTGALPA